MHKGKVMNNRRVMHVKITSDLAAKEVQRLWDRLNEKLPEMEEKAVRVSLSRWISHEKALKAAGV